MRILSSKWYVAAMVTLFAASAFAAGHRPVVYSGELMAENGLPYTGSVEVLIEVFDAGMGGNSLLTQGVTTVDVVAGVLDIELGIGGQGPLMELLSGGDELWLEFTVDGETLSPRQELTAAPYALAAANARTLEGFSAADFAMADAPVGAMSLPTDGINQVSNGALSNTFTGVNHAWTGGPQNIPDFDGGSPGSVSASLGTGEGAGSYITDVTIFTQFTLGAISSIMVTLHPPEGLGLDPVVVVNEQRTPGSYAEGWNPDNAPGLGAWLGIVAAGTWSVTITDNDDTLAGANPVGTLDGFDVSYDVVRADHMVVDGRLDVSQEINAPVVNAPQMNVQRITYSGDGSTSSAAPRAIRYNTPGSVGCQGPSGNIWTETFTANSDATALITLGAIHRGSGNSQIRMLIDGSVADYLFHNEAGTWNNSTLTWVGELTAGEHSVTVQTETGVGICSGYGGMNILLFEK